MSRALLKVKAGIEKTAAHDEIYDRDYYLKYTDFVEKLSKGVAKSIATRYAPAEFIDVGCGSGEVLQAVAAHGITVYGFDNSQAALQLCREKDLSVELLDLEKSPVPKKRSDVVLSMEVAEHIPAAYADDYVGFLVGTSDTVIITAAPPGQGGTDHVNEQPKSYWIKKFADAGFDFDQAENSEVQSEWLKFGVGRQRSRNMLVFHKAGSQNA